MLGKIKKALGIEGIKMELLLDDHKSTNNKISGILRFTTKSKGTVKGMTVKVIERYSRGRRKNKLVNEYPIGILEIKESFTITPEETVDIPFKMTYQIALSEMDKLERDNLLFKPLIMLAKKLKNVKSTYFVLAEADVKGTTLNPFDKKEIKLKI